MGLSFPHLATLNFEQLQTEQRFGRRAEARGYGRNGNFIMRSSETRGLLISLTSNPKL